MFEFDKSPASRAGHYSCEPTRGYEPVREISAASLLFWGEHCIECAAPSCFTSCALYQARADGRCRRFTWGIARNGAFPSARGFGAEISFKQWGKLETRGNTALLNWRWLTLLERALGGIAPILNGLGRVVAKLARDARWRDITVRAMERLGRRLHARAAGGAIPDAFLLEVYNPSSAPLRLLVSMTVARKELGHKLDPTALLPSFRKLIELPSGYSRHEIARAEFRSVSESNLPFDVALTPEGDANPTLVFLSADFVRFGERRDTVTIDAKELPAVKCVVWDLDGTLWRGTLLEDGEVEPLPEVIALIRRLDERGILVSVASKNDYDAAWAKVADIGLAEYILFPQINWLPKSENIKIIADRLNIALDTFVFVDDNPFERDEVTSALPMVTCLDPREIGTIADQPRFHGSQTAEARSRRMMYREAMLREREEHRFGTDFFGFLRSCAMELRILRYTREHFDRVSELVQRTNQLNFSGRKYRREEVGPVLEDAKLEKWVLECSDRFGSYGIVGCAIVTRVPGEVRIDDFMLSCRVQGRFVEQAFFAALVRDERRLWVNFRATGRNTPALQLLQSLGFESCPDGVGMALDLSQRDLTCDFIVVSGDIGHRVEPTSVCGSE